MPEEMNRGLGSIGAPSGQEVKQSQVGTQGNAQAVAIPNSSLAMLNEKRKADNVVQERNTGITLNNIKDEAKAELLQDMMASEADMQQRMYEKENATNSGYQAGLYDAASLQKAAAGGAMQSQMIDNPMQGYPEQRPRQNNGLGNLY